MLKRNVRFRFSFGSLGLQCLPLCTPILVKISVKCIEVGFGYAVQHRYPKYSFYYPYVSQMSRTDLTEGGSLAKNVNRQ